MSSDEPTRWEGRDALFQDQHYKHELQAAGNRKYNMSLSNGPTEILKRWFLLGRGDQLQSFKRYYPATFICISNTPESNCWNPSLKSQSYLPSLKWADYFIQGWKHLKETNYTLKCSTKVVPKSSPRASPSLI